jgi:hypothetical protein
MQKVALAAAEHILSPFSQVPSLSGNSFKIGSAGNSTRNGGGNYEVNVSVKRF